MWGERPLSLAETADILAIIRDSLLILVFLMILMLLVVTYRKLSAVLNSARKTLKNVEEVAAAVSGKIVGPATAGSGVAFGAGKLAAFVLGFSRKKRKKKGGNNDG